MDNRGRCCFYYVIRPQYHLPACPGSSTGSYWAGGVPAWVGASLRFDRQDLRDFEPQLNKKPERFHGVKMFL